MVDASIAVKWLVSEKFSNAAASLLTADHVLIAPDLLYVEASNALWAMLARGDFTADDYSEAIDILVDAPITVPSTHRSLVPSAARLARDLNHPVYDCVYLALAIQEQHPLITADARFFRKVADHPYLADRAVHIESLG